MTPEHASTQMQSLPIQPSPFLGAFAFFYPFPAAGKTNNPRFDRIVVFLKFSRTASSHTRLPILVHPLHNDTRVAGNTRPEFSGLLADWPSDGGALHLTLGVDDLCNRTSAWVSVTARGDARVGCVCQNPPSNHDDCGASLTDQPTTGGIPPLTTPALSSK